MVYWMAYRMVDCLVVPMAAQTAAQSKCQLVARWAVQRACWKETHWVDQSVVQRAEMTAGRWANYWAGS